MNHLINRVMNQSNQRRFSGLSIGIILLLTLLLIILLQNNVVQKVLAETNGTTYYVATNGADSNAGTQSQPFATIQKALKLAKAGDTIQVRGGTYHEAIRIATSGAPGQPITLMAYPGEKPILDGQYTLPEGTIARCNNEVSPPVCFTFNALVRIMGSHIRFSGFELKRSYGRGITVGDTVRTLTTDVIIDNCSIHDVRNNQIQVRFAEDILVQNCVAYHGSDYATHSRSTSELNWPSMVIALDANRVTFRGNTVYNNWGAGVTAGAGSSNVTIEDNVIYDNIGLQSYVHRTRDVIIRRNLMYHTNNPNFLRGGNPSGCIGLNNEKDFADSHYVKGVEIYDNVLSGCSKNIAFWSSDGTKTLIENVTIRHNTLVNATGNTARSAINISITCDANVRNIVLEKNLILQQNPARTINPCLGNQAAGASAQTTAGENALEQFIGQAPDTTQIRYVGNLWWPAVPNGMTSGADLVADPKLENPHAALSPGQVQLAWYRPQPSSPAQANNHGAQAIFGGSGAPTATPGHPNQPTPTMTPTPMPPRPTPVGCLPATGNIIVNPGFETGQAPWRFHTNGAGTYKTAAPGFECNYAAQLQIKKQGRNVTFYQKQINLEPDVRYRLSFYAASNSGNDLQIYLEKNGGNRANHGVKAMRADLTNQWRLFTTEFTATNLKRSGNNARLRFWLAPYDEAGDEYWIDQVMLEKISDGRSNTPAAPEVEVVELIAEADDVITGGTISGFIQIAKADGSQVPLGEIEVTVIDDETEGFAFEAIVETDEEGYYFVDGVPIGLHTLQIAPPIGYLVATADTLQIEGEEAIERTYTLQQAASIFYLPLVTSK